ncbi:peptidoglycan-binding protein [Meridianimarinicoccus sp. MJW13]|uniref:peptidoglycan-binding protein n=1 Tax=Meridianimarinicoccus sp. MJW13 TaxID=2720031 RepID=UPI0018680FD9|nr:peptidoglycan-binding protein [Fluviibacterium sp. MJW13]
MRDRIAFGRGFHRLVVSALCLGGVALFDGATQKSLAEGFSATPPLVLAQATTAGLSQGERQVAQLGLNALGIDVGIADGVFGPSTRAGIRRFQQALGAPPTGELTRAQFDRLQQVYQQAKAAGTVDTPLSPAELRELQGGLKLLGFYNGKIDGVAGKGTNQAVTRFLQNSGHTQGQIPMAEVLELVRTQVAGKANTPGNTQRAGPSFSCDQAGTPTEHAICGSDGLALLDRTLAEAYQYGLSRQHSTRTGDFREGQRAWLARRNACGANKTCLRDEMMARIETLAPGQYTQILVLADRPEFLSVGVGDTQQTPGASQAVPVADNPELAALAAEYGIPTKNGYLIAKHPQILLSPEPHVIAPDQLPTADGAWTRLETLAWVARYPDRFQEGTAFVGLAANFLEGAAFDAFFPDRGKLNQALARGGTVEDWNVYGVNPFGDEFAYADKKQEFFDEIFPRILAKAPDWPLPIMHVVPFRLGAYDTTRGAFPLSTVMLGNQAALHVASFESQDRVVSTPIASAELITPLPQWLEMPLEEARLLRAGIQGDQNVYLAWYAELDWGADVVAPPVSVDSSVQTPRTPRGTAALKHIGIYRDAQVSDPIKIFDVATFGKASPTTAEPPKSAVSDTGEIDVAKIDLDTGYSILRQAADLLPPDFARNLALRTVEARRANELDQAEILARLEQEFNSYPTQEVWLSSSVNLGQYDTQTGTFDLTGQVPAFHAGSSRNKYSVQFQVTMLEPVALDKLAVPVEVARYLIERKDRRISLALLVDIDRAAMINEATIGLFVRPKALAYYYDDHDTQQRVGVGSKTIEAGTGPSQPLAEDFSDDQVPFTMATAGILYAASQDEAARAQFLDDLMPLIWLSERDGFAVPGQGFFPKGSPFPSGGVATAFLPEFTAWVDAKSRSLANSTFLIAADGPRSGSEGCRFGRSVEANTSYVLSPLGAELGAGQVAVDRRALESLQTPALMDREILFYTANWQTPGKLCSFSDWNLFAEISKAGAPASLSPNGQYLRTVRSFVAKLDMIELRPGNTPLPDVVFRFDAEETLFHQAGISDDRTNPVHRLSAQGPSAQELAEKAKAEEAAKPFQPEHKVWSGSYQCAGVTAAQITMTFDFPSATRVTANVQFNITAPNPEAGSFSLDGAIDKSTGAFDFTGGRWIYNAQGRPVPQMSGRFVEGGRALDLTMAGGQCYGFDLRPGEGNVTQAPQQGTPQPQVQPAPEVTAPADVSEQDIVGLRTGMTMDEAQSIILREFRIPAVYEANAPSPGDLRALAYMRVFISENADQVIALFSPSRSEPIVAIARHVNKRNGPFDYQNLGARLVEKYGATSHVADGQTAMTWSDGPTCAPLQLQVLPQRYFNPLQGVSSGGALPGQSDLQYAVSDIGVLLPPDASDLLRNAECGRVLQYGTTSYAPRTGVSVFSLFLVDLEAVRRIDGVPEGPQGSGGDEIKL